MENPNIDSTSVVDGDGLFIQRIRELLNYCPTTGLFTWKVSRRGTAKAGSRAGCRNNEGYLIVGIDGVYYKAHRLAYAIHHGTMPPRGTLVDHIDGNPANNRIENLRLATRSENGQNRQHLSKRNSSGVTGVYWYIRDQKWQARIKVNDRSIHLGLFTNKQDAIAARRIAEAKHFGEFAPTRNHWPSIQRDLFADITHE
jgi:hypothetical protein